MATSAIATSQPQPAERIDYRRLLWVAPLAAAVAAIANLALYFIADALGAFPDGILLPNGQTMGPAPVISTSVIGVIAAAIVFAVLGRFSARPIRLFRIVALVALVLSFASPFGIAGAGAAYIGTLLLMHVVAALAAIGFFTTLARKA